MLLDFLAQLKANQYLVAVEEFSFQCDVKKREQLKMQLTVSTFVKQ